MALSQFVCRVANHIATAERENESIPFTQWRARRQSPGIQGARQGAAASHRKRECSSDRPTAAFTPRSRPAAAAKLSLRSAAFRDWLIDGYFRACGELPSDWSIRRVRAALEATARFEGGTPSIFVRVGHDGQTGNGRHGSACYLDLADPDGRAVRIGPEGWSVVDRPRRPFSAPRWALAASHPHPRRLDRPAPALCQPLRPRLPPPGRLDGRRPPARSVRIRSWPSTASTARPRAPWPGSSAG